MRRLTDAETKPIMLAAGLKPLVPYPGGVHVPWLSKCDKCDREVMPHYSSIQQGRGGCLTCAGKKVDLAIVIATMASAGLTPLVPYPGCMKRWRCRHTCGREVRPRYNDVQQRGGGCRTCASRRYDPNRPGCVYLIKFDGHPSFPSGVIKIGMAGGQFRRLDEWRQRGWTFLEVLHCDDGKVPVIVEREVLKWLKDDLGLEPCLSADDVGIMRGHTETVSVADLADAGVSVSDVREKVKQLVKKASALTLD